MVISSIPDCSGSISAPTTRYQPGSSLIEAIASWCESASGNQPLQAGLGAIVQCLGGEAGAISRFDRRKSACGRAIVFDFHTVSSGTRIVRSFAPGVLGNFTGRTREETLWFSSMTDTGKDPGLAELQRKRRFAELVVIPLSVDSKSIDFLEIHFSTRVDAELLGMLNGVLGTLCRIWRRRTPGVFLESALSQPAISGMPEEGIYGTSEKPRSSSSLS